MTAPSPTPAPSAELPPLPPAIVAIQAQCRALRAQLDALEASVEAFANGMRASVARAQADVARQSRAVGAMSDTFMSARGSPSDPPNAPAAAPPSGDTSAVLDRLSPAPSSSGAWPNG